MDDQTKHPKDVELADDVKQKLLAKKRESEEEFGELDDVDLDKIAGGVGVHHNGSSFGNIRRGPRSGLRNPAKTLDP